MPNRDIVAIGGSAGSIEVLRRVVADLPPDLEAAVFVVVHLGHTPSILPAILNEAGPLPAKFGVEGEPVERGRIYVAPPDRHLLVVDGRLVLRRGPRENSARPAIDPLFRSVGAAYGSRAIGIVLSGALSDGAAGLLAIKRCRGIAVVQDPADADHPSMPQAALAAAAVDHVVASGEIAALIERLVAEQAEPPRPAPADIVREAAIAAVGVAPGPDIVSDSKHVFSCPDCGGPLSIIDDRMIRLRCAVGHAHTAESLLDAQAAQIEKALWVAHRTNRERAAVLRRMAADARDRDQSRTAALWDEKAGEFEEHASLLHRLLMSGDYARPPVEAQVA